MREFKTTLKVINFSYELAAMVCMNLLYNFSYPTYVVTDYRIGIFIFLSLYVPGRWLTLDFKIYVILYYE